MTTRTGIRWGGLLLAFVLSLAAVSAAAWHDRVPEAARGHVGQQQAVPGHHAPGPDTGRPVPTSSADWDGVGNLLGRPGKMTPDNLTYRVFFPRSDLSVTSQGVQLALGTDLSNFAAFTVYADGQVMMMGDLVVTEQELEPAIDAIQAGDFAQHSIHKHLLSSRPALWWLHFDGMGGAGALARRFMSALRATGTPLAPTPAGRPVTGLNTAGINTALGYKGSSFFGTYVLEPPRRDTFAHHRRVLPPVPGPASSLRFQPLPDGRALANGDIAVREQEVQPVLRALRAARFTVVSLHNHFLDVRPSLYFTHFWAVGDEVRLARVLRKVLDRTNSPR
ncbi:LppY/LpqO family protein [Streptomyces olivaceiscleroticus]|uniref:DUF1259 domain-containing protein n=1 Tax=Streptomyces olivaceiscleroticus TaxID=68245 RepID=A0ABN1BCL6_9ACTN